MVCLFVAHGIDAAPVLDTLLRKVVVAYQIKPFKPEPLVFGAKERLGQALFFDPILSGPQNIACATCHVRSKASGDGMRVAVALGGGSGVGDVRLENEDAFVIPRNVLPFFNRGSKDFVAFFWDGKVQTHADGSFESPLGRSLPVGFDSLLAVAASFPMAEQDEMLGRSARRLGGRGTHHGQLVGPQPDPDNFQQRAIRVYPNLIKRLLLDSNEVSENTRDRYRKLFAEAYPGVDVERLGMAHIGNALAAYISIAFQTKAAPWDRYVSGDNDAINTSQKRGALLFYGKGRCAVCHAGTQFSDFRFHGLAIPQIDVGKHGKNLDYGRAAATSRGEDRYKFRTAPLRNAALSGPWGHNGAFDSLRAVIQHHFNPVPMLWAAQRHSAAEAAQAGRLLGFRSPILAEIEALDDLELNDIEAFIGSLTSPTVLSDAQALPLSVPSGKGQFIRP